MICSKLQSEILIPKGTNLKSTPMISEIIGVLLRFVPLVELLLCRYFERAIQNKLSA